MSIGSSEVIAIVAESRCHNAILRGRPLRHSLRVMMWIARELTALVLAALFAMLAISVPVSSDENVSFFVALIGALAIWEAARYFWKLRLAGR